jgi:hypothetical protein
MSGLTAGRKANHRETDPLRGKDCDTVQHSSLLLNAVLVTLPLCEASVLNQADNGMGLLLLVVEMGKVLTPLVPGSVDVTQLDSRLKVLIEPPGWKPLEFRTEEGTRP